MECGRENYKHLELFTNFLLLTQRITPYMRDKEKSNKYLAP